MRPHNVIEKEHNLIVRKHNGYCESVLFCLVCYSDAKMDAAKLITLYFELGLLQKDISRRTLQRMLKKNEIMSPTIQ